MARGEDQSFDCYLPETTTLINTCSGPGLGIGESMMLTEVSFWTMASFMLDEMMVMNLTVEGWGCTVSFR